MTTTITATSDIIQWIGVGIALTLCVIYIIKRLRNRKVRQNHKDNGCQCSSCDLYNTCNKSTKS